ncbi:hypothetical protein EA187_14365 [Lujinxingia sediminis]|uniref:Tip attachment protein J domain-containing protein n=1 Tax=Lujinxingia sediminis TaxID=2480984 RepID=A0ABY0CQC6_9DELT|nr:hypothetical protein [Lujinxingia sediminis]RVU42697.1 hypothetical protein EA187_14365 [Lujinxingia sediminis]
MTLRRYKGLNKGCVVVLEGVRAGTGNVSLIGTYGDVPADLDLGDVAQLVGPPSDPSTGVDMVTGSMTISQQTATFVASERVCQAIEQARAVQDYGEAFQWTMPGLSEVEGFVAAPGRYVYRVSGEAPPHSEFHTSTTTYAVKDLGGGEYNLMASLPLPFKNATEVVAYVGSPPLAGRRMLIIDYVGGKVRWVWRQFIERRAYSAQQNEVEITAVDPMRPLEGLVDERRYAHVQAALQPFGRWIGTVQLETGEAITPPPSGNDPPGRPVVELDDVVLVPGQGGVFIGNGLINTPSMLASDDEVGVVDGRARVVYAHDQSGLLGTQTIAQRTGLGLVRDWLRFFQQSPKIVGGLITYDGSPWKDLIAIEEFDTLEETAEQLDHSLIDVEMGLSELAGWALSPQGYFLRLRNDGALGVARRRFLTPFDLLNVYGADPKTPAHRLAMLPSRIDISDPVRAIEATYVAEVGGVVSRIEPDVIEVRRRRAPTDPAPRYTSSERRFDFRAFSRGRRDFVSLLLVEAQSALSRAPTMTVEVPLDDFSAADHRQLPPVGEWLRIEGGPETGVIGPEGTRILPDEDDVRFIGLVTAIRLDRVRHTAEVELMMSNWYGDDVLPRVIAPEMVVKVYNDRPEKQVVEVRGSLEENMFMVGDQVQFYDRDNQPISSTVYKVLKPVSTSDVALFPSLQDEDADLLDAYMGEYGRGVVLKLADLGDYKNDWWNSLTGQSSPLQKPDNRYRIWTYWDADPSPDSWTTS